MGIVDSYDEKTGLVSVIQKNRFFKGSEVEFLRPNGDFIKFKIEYMENADGEEMEIANRPQSVAKIKTDFPLEKDSMMRGIRKN